MSDLIFLRQVLEAKDTLVQCILASLLPDDSGITPPKEFIFVQLDDGTVRLEVQVGVINSSLVIRYLGRATAVHIARRNTDTIWKYWFKMAWLCAVRLYGGEVLERLQGVTGVVRLLGWDAQKKIDFADFSPLWTSSRGAPTTAN